ncbi:MAG: SGNH/GDSL hydrolase family protein [Actinomycetota bacterium]|nr:SGNH/GDSL hydrolase family protein [Actinomycetota bacterium]
MKTILCYGDSNTYGCKPIGFDQLEQGIIASDYRYGPQQRWPGVLQKELGTNYHIIEEGLNGRTTVFDDPVEGIYKNGIRYLPACLESHAPLDVVIIMLGTNDLKKKFSASAFDVALGLGQLVSLVKGSGAGPGGSSPQVLMLCPPPVGKLTQFALLFEGAEQKSKQLAGFTRKVARQSSCHFMEVAQVIMPSGIDGIHYEEESHYKLGVAVAEYIKNNIS